jgi:hypothetical protein
MDSMNDNDPFDIGGLVFPIVSGTSRADIFAVDRFIGCGFWIDSKGHFLTCKHVLDELKEGQNPAIAQPFGNEADRFIPVLETTAHAKFDMAVGKAARSTPTKFLPPRAGNIFLGLNVSAFGFTEWGKLGQSLNVDVRYLKGHVSRTSTEPSGLPTPHVVEVSFGSPSGFSGAPLLVDFQVVGMLYSNVESKLQGYSISEVQDGGNVFRETAYRIYEYGLSHRVADLTSFLESCGITPFE